MRHISTLIAAVFVAPSAWLLLAFGQDRSAPASNGIDFVRPVLLLTGAGLLLGLLATLRFSPLGVLVTGGCYAIGYLALLIAPDGVLGLFPPSLTVAGRVADPAAPLRTGTALVLGTVLLGVAIGAGRHRRPAAEPMAEPVRDRPPGATGPRPAPPAPDTGTVLAGRSVNGRPNTYRPAGKGAERWVQTRQSAWPFG